MLPEWSEGLDPRGSITLATLSYSLSMVCPPKTFRAGPRHTDWDAYRPPDPLILPSARPRPCRPRPGQRTRWRRRLLHFQRRRQRSGTSQPFERDGLTGECLLTLRLVLQAIGSAKRQVGWFSRWFWQVWFDFDHVHLGEDRRSYLEYKYALYLFLVPASIADRRLLGRFGTIKSYNGRNGFIIPLLIQIPYYCFIGCSRQRCVR
jgi:hypothetical protein